MNETRQKLTEVCVRGRRALVRRPREGPRAGAVGAAKEEVVPRPVLDGAPLVRVRRLVEAGLPGRVGGEPLDGPSSAVDRRHEDRICAADHVWYLYGTLVFLVAIHKLCAPRGNSVRRVRLPARRDAAIPGRVTTSLLARDPASPARLPPAAVALRVRQGPLVPDHVALRVELETPHAAGAAQLAVGRVVEAGVRGVVDRRSERVGAVGEAVEIVRGESVAFPQLVVELNPLARVGHGPPGHARRDEDAVPILVVEDLIARPDESGPVGRGRFGEGADRGRTDEGRGAYAGRGGGAGDALAAAGRLAVVGRAVLVGVAGFALFKARICVADLCGAVEVVRAGVALSKVTGGAGADPVDARRRRRRRRWAWARPGA